MPIMCDHCGKKIQKYCVISYTTEYLEQYISDYFERPISDIKIGNIRKPEYAKFRGIFFIIMRDFSSLKPYMIAPLYGLSVTAMNDAIRNLKKTDHDYLFISKDLANNLPEIIKQPNGQH